MGYTDASSTPIAESAKVVDSFDGSKAEARAKDEETRKNDELAALTTWVVGKVKAWRDHRRANYEQAWDQYERLWRGFWAPEDANRRSEKSMLVTPGLGEAVENIVAEVEEATWGRGDSFDIKAQFEDGDDAKKITDDNKARLKEDLGRADFNCHVGEALINAAVYGSGIGEILIEEFTLREITASVQAAFPQSPMPAPDLASAAPAMPSGAQAGAPSPEPTPMDAGAPPPMAPDMSQMPADASQMAPQMPPAPPMQPPMSPMGGLGQGMMPPAPKEAKVIEKKVQFAALQSVNPRNFCIDPTARSVDKALGVAIEEYVGAHIINEGQRTGKYRKVDVGTSAGDTQLLPDRQVENEYVHDKVQIIRYYGLVPKHLIFPPDRTADLSDVQPDSQGEALGAALRQAEDAADQAQEQIVPISELMGTSEEQKSDDPVDSEMIEAMVVIANEGICLKAVENPFLMKDRPVVAFPWDVVPGRFWGRGVCEKGMVPQRVMDAELRARIDSLAFISAPMMAMDASRLPRGFQLTVRPGKSILTNGDPNQILRPMHFGQLEQSTFTHSQQLDQMIQRATGSLDVIALAQRGAGDSRSGATSMMLSGIVKRHKRTLMGFIDRFYIPALRKIMWRNMQYYPERYEPVNWNFVASSTMGIIQREYESQTLTQLLSTVDPQSQEYKMLLMGVVANTGLAHRQEIIDMLKQSIQTAQQMQAAQAQAAAHPDVQNMQAQVQSMGLQLQLRKMQAEINELDSRAALQTAKTQNAQLEPQLRTAELATKGIYQVQADQQDREIKRRMDFMNATLKAQDTASNERIAAMQSRASVASAAIKARAEAARAGADAAKAQAAAPKHIPVPVPHPVPVPVPVAPRPVPVIQASNPQILG